MAVFAALKWNVRLPWNQIGLEVFFVQHTTNGRDHKPSFVKTGWKVWKTFLQSYRCMGRKIFLPVFLRCPLEEVIMYGYVKHMRH